ncbi:MAG TPA: GGDEF domain-containing protein [Bryobacteraceae bacterium]|nr:GGDEF domain-containing protein [Bryobacteraceae bacterium]
MVISLRKHIEDSTENAKAAVEAFKSAIELIAKTGAQAIPPLGAGLLAKLNVIQENLPREAVKEQVLAARAEFEQDIESWGDSAAEYSRNKEKEIRDIMIAVAVSAEALAERDQRYASQFGGLTTRLHSIAAMQDLSAIRRSVVQSAAEMKSAVDKMTEENEESVAQLRAEVAHYRAKLEQSEAREAVDPLTGLSNRRETESQMQDRIVWRRQFCVAVLDLNGFKKINDVHGHVAGDNLLRQFANEMKAHFRSTDVVGRWGGDEFIVIIDSTLEEAQSSVDRVRKWAFGDYTISTGKGSVQVPMRASIGVAAWDKKETMVELLARADAVMYAEKRVRSIPRAIVA